MDEISTGLDSSKTFQIVNSIRQTIHIIDGTAVTALLQPAPEPWTAVCWLENQEKDNVYFVKIEQVKFTWIFTFQNAGRIIQINAMTYTELLRAADASSAIEVCTLFWDR